MKNIITISILFFCFLPNQAKALEGFDTDSLKKLLLNEDDMEKRGLLMYQIGEGYFSNNKDSSIHYLNLSFQVFTLMDNLEYQSKCAAVLSMAFQYSDPVLSAEYILKSVELAELNGDSNQIAYSYNILGSHYRVNGELELSKEYFYKVIDLRLALKDSLGLAVAYNNIGIVYMMSSEYDEGLDYWKKSLEIKLAIGEELSAAYTMANIAIYYKDIGRYYEAKEYAENAFEIELEMFDYEGCSHSLAVMGDMYVLLNNNGEAIKAYKRSMDFADSVNTDYNKLDPLIGISRAYENSGKYELSVDALREYIKLSKKYYDESKAKATSELSAKFESDKKDQENLILKGEIEVNEAHIEEVAAKNELQETNNRYLVLGLGLVFIILIVSIIFLTKVRSAKREIEAQKHLVDEKNREITDSISYAKRLQEAILPPLDVIQNYFRDSFVYYAPKDIVAGDFYWMEKTENTVLLAVADCTGHGVPGAMVSVVCNNALNRSVREFKLRNPNEILDKVTDLVIETFEKSQEEVKDGMDIALCQFDLKNNVLEYAGANNSIYIVRDGELIEHKADKQPIGKYADRKAFNQVKIELKKDDLVYLFTDGYADQFGGEKGKKLKYKPFKKLLTNNSNQPMSEQRSVIEREFNNWKADLEQIDDVCVIGVRV